MSLLFSLRYRHCSVYTQSASIFAFIHLHPRLRLVPPLFPV